MATSSKKRKVAKITLWVSIPILLLSMAMFFVFNAIYNAKLKKEIALEEGGLVTKIWEDIPLPIFEKLYFFNITNPDSFLKGEKLNVVEVGPYTYKARWFKPDPKWNPNNTVSYREIRIYEFVPEMSIGTQDDLIFTLNAPLLLAANFAKDSKWKKALSFFLTLEGETMIIEKSVRELVYDGYSDAIIKYARYVKNIPYKEGKFSWLYGKNDTDDGLFTVFTGTDDETKTNIINKWNGQEFLSFWKGDSCNSINGSTSIETGPPIKGETETYTFFQTIFCRSLTFNYTGDVNHYNIPAKRFQSTYDLFANSTENSDNICFEVNEEHASGILDVSPCQYGAPVFISFPHFHLGDSSLIDNVIGMYPNKSLHDSHIDVEPITGMSIHLEVRFQINIKLKNDPDISQFHKTRDGIYPVFWAELSLKIDEDMADFLKSHVRRPKIIAYSIIAVVGILCFILIFVSVLVFAFTSGKDKDGYIEQKIAKEHLIKNQFDQESNIQNFAAPPTNDQKTNNYAAADDNSLNAGNLAKDSLEVLREQTTPISVDKIYPSLQ